MKVVLISCVGKKRNSPSQARDLYISPLFKGAYQYARNLKADRIFILSAKYGLVEETEIIEPYDETLNNKRIAELRAWATKVLESLSKKTDLQSDEFVFLAGEKYRRFLVENIKNVSIPLEGKRIGEQLAFYREILHDSPDE